jgi:hypothetical protein
MFKALVSRATYRQHSRWRRWHWSRRALTRSRYISMTTNARPFIARILHQFFPRPRSWVVLWVMMQTEASGISFLKLRVRTSCCAAWTVSVYLCSTAEQWVDQATLVINWNNARCSRVHERAVHFLTKSRTTGLPISSVTGKQRKNNRSFVLVLLETDGLLVWRLFNNT